MSDRLTPLDAGFLEVEDSDSHTSLAIGALVVIEGPTPSDHDFLERLASRVGLIPHGADCLHTVHADLAAPSWTPDRGFDPAHHFMRSAVPAPGGMREMSHLVAWIMSERLDRDHPLWQCWLIEGIERGRWAVFTKAHHSLMDGVSGVRLFDALFDPPSHADPHSAPATPTSTLEHPASLVDTVLDATTSVLTAPLRIAGQGLRTAGGFAQLASDVLVPSASTTLIGAIGKQRSYTTATVPMADVDAITSAFDVTVNDVALACVTSSLRSLLLRRNERPDKRAARCLVPVSIRVGEDDASPHNEISLLLPFLPVDIADPAQRLRAVHERLSRHKRGGESRGGQVVTKVAQLAPFVSSAWLVRLAASLPQRSVVTVATDLPGPRRRSTLMGRAVLAIYPYVPIAVRIRLGFAVLSYNGQLTFGVTADYDSVPEIDSIPTLLENELRTLLIRSAGAR